MLASLGTLVQIYFALIDSIWGVEVNHDIGYLIWNIVGHFAQLIIFVKIVHLIIEHRDNIDSSETRKNYVTVANLALLQTFVCEITQVVGYFIFGFYVSNFGDSG